MDDELFDALADDRRRQLLVDLLDDSPRDASVQAATPGAEREEQSERIRLQHIHLPKLADCGFVDWNQGSDSVTRGPRFDELRPFLELCEEYEGVTASDD